MASLSAPSLDAKKLDKRKSCDTVSSSLCSSNSSCILQKRKPVHPLATGLKFKNSNTIKQRVLSAKFLKFKTLQNELNDANYHIAQLISENKLLKNLQKRQDKALSKYEGAKAELPQVLGSHQEEIRVLQARNKNLRKNIKELNDKLKIREDEIMSLKDQNKHFTNLCKNKNLEERDKLTRKIEDLEITLKDRDNIISNLNRKISVEQKNYKYKLNAEINKNKYLQKELHKAMSQLEELNNMIEGKDKTDSRARRNVSNERKKALLLKLNAFEENDKLDPKKLASSGSTGSIINSVDSSGSSSSIINSHENGEDTYIKESIKAKDKKKSAKISSEIQLKTMVDSLQKKSLVDDSFNENLDDICADILLDAEDCNHSVEKHIFDFHKNAKESKSLLSVLKENDEISKKFSHITLSDDKLTVFDYTDFFKLKDNNLISKINNDKSNGSSLEGIASVSLNKTSRKSYSNSHRSDGDETDKEMLLAKLRAIDNGENIEISNVKKSKQDLIKELFG